jgi:hypothetical protein
VLCLQLRCIPADEKLISIGLPLKSSMVSFLKASAYVTDSFRLDSECGRFSRQSCVENMRTYRKQVAGGPLRMHGVEHQRCTQILWSVECQTMSS